MIGDEKLQHVYLEMLKYCRRGGPVRIGASETTVTGIREFAKLLLWLLVFSPWSWYLVWPQHLAFITWQDWAGRVTQ